MAVYTIKFGGTYYIPEGRKRKKRRPRAKDGRSQRQRQNGKESKGTRKEERER